MSARTAARRYANALFELCLEQKALEPVRADLTNLTLLLDASPEWRTFVTEPSGPKNLRERAIRELLQPKCHPLTTKFMAFLDHKSRITIFEMLVEEWMKRYDEHLGNLRASVVSAAALDERQLQSLTEKLSRKFGRNVILTASVDADLIGGLRIFAGDQVIDLSIETQLQQLQKRLTFAI
jgi:F-type H+-transporting ATPase subunit delta